MDWYFTTARSGTELSTAEALTWDGYEAWCGRKVVRKRKPHDRHEDAPYLPRYVFLSLSPDQYHALTHGADQYEFTTLSRRFIELPSCAARDLARFQREVEEKHKADWRAVEAGERLSQYRPGQQVVITAGPFLSQALTTFAGETADGKARIEREMMGRRVTMDVAAEYVEAV